MLKVIKCVNCQMLIFAGSVWCAVLDSAVFSTDQKIAAKAFLLVTYIGLKKKKKKKEWIQVFHLFPHCFL